MSRPNIISVVKPPDKAAFHRARRKIPVEVSWLETAREFGDAIPEPGEIKCAKFVQCPPRSLHIRLQAQAKQEGVSMNALVTAIIAEGLGRREERQ